MTYQLKKIYLFSFTLLCFLYSPLARSAALSQDDIDGMQFQMRSAVLFRADNFIGGALSFLTNSKFSHAGVELEDIKTGKRYVIEATGSAKEVVLEQDYPYVRITSLDEILDEYNGSVTRRLIEYAEGQEPDVTMVTKLARELNGDLYETNPFELVRPVVTKVPVLGKIAGKFLDLLDGKDNSSSTTTSSSGSSSESEEDGIDPDGLPTIKEDNMICSALVAKMLQYVGILPEEMDYRDFDPGDLSNEHPRHVLINGATWGAQELLKGMPASSSDDDTADLVLHEQSDDDGQLDWGSGASEEGDKA